MWEEAPHSKIESCKRNRRRRDLWCVTQRPVGQPDSVLTYTEFRVLVVSCVESQTQPSSSLSPWAVSVWRARLSHLLRWVSEPCVWRARLSHLLRWVTEPCVCGEPDSATFFCWVTEPHVYRKPDSTIFCCLVSVPCACKTDSATFCWVLCAVHSYPGRLSKSLLSLWRRLSHLQTEFLWGVHIVKRVRLS